MNEWKRWGGGPLLGDNCVVERGVFLTDASGTDPFEAFELQFAAHAARHPDALAVEPVFAFVAADHETIVVRLPANAPQPLRIVFRVVVRVVAIRIYSNISTFCKN